MTVQDVAFLIVVATPLLLIPLSWALAADALHGNAVRWRVWVSFAGCIALTLAVAIPWFAIFFSMLLLDWDRLVIWCLVSGCAALLAGIFGVRAVRFPLIFGALTISGLVVIIPVGVL
jgi:hypothetical protein